MPNRNHSKGDRYGTESITLFSDCGEGTEFYESGGTLCAGHEMVGQDGIGCFYRGWRLKGNARTGIVNL